MDGRDTTIWISELEHCREQLPRATQETKPRMVDPGFGKTKIAEMKELNNFIAIMNGYDECNCVLCCCAFDSACGYLTTIGCEFRDY